MTIIGGYYELELENKTKLPDNSVNLNNARNCLRYTIRTYKIKEINIPYYVCPAVWQAIQKENCKIHFYHINKNLLPAVDFQENDFILYTNYFGICAKNVKELADKYKNLIVDNAQAFYMPKYGISSFNSIRKFFGVSDGAFLYIDKKEKLELKKDTSYQRFSHLLKSADIDYNFGYQDYCKYEDSFVNEDIKLMSNLTEKLYCSIDVESAKEKRLSNFYHLHDSLKSKNELRLALDKDDVPMYYPLLCNNISIKNSLIKNEVFLPKYWNSMPKEWIESYIRENMLLLPIDRRYNEKDMDKIIEYANI